MRLLRYSLAFVFIWYGFAKPLGISPATAVVRPTFQSTPVLPMVMHWTTFFDLLGVFEGVVGLLLLSRRTVKFAVGMLAVQMGSTFAPFFVAPEIVWTWTPLVPTAVGLYIIKNFVLATGGVVLLTTISPQSFSAGFETRHTMSWLRAGIAICFVWSGLLTVAVGADPGLWMAAAIPDAMVSDKVFVGLIGVLEVLIGLYVLGPSRTTRHTASYLAIVYLLFSLLPALLVPSEVFLQLPYEPSFEGVYIFKDLVLVSAVIVADSYYSFEWNNVGEREGQEAMFVFGSRSENEHSSETD